MRPIARSLKGRSATGACGQQRYRARTARSLCCVKPRPAGVPFSLMLADCHMPDMDGFMLVEQMQQSPDLAGLVTIMLTSGGQRGDGLRCKELGIAAYLIKPVLQADLLEALLQVLASHEGAVKPAAGDHAPHAARGPLAAANPAGRRQPGESEAGCRACSKTKGTSWWWRPTACSCWKHWRGRASTWF